jgi:hypothetical protein
MYELPSYLSLTALFIITNGVAAHGQANDRTARLTGTVRDTASGAPLRGASVRVSRGTVVVATATTAVDGRYVERGLAAGTYTVTATRIGYRPESRSVDVPATGDVDFTLAPGATHLAPVNVTAGTPVAIDPRNGDQTFQQQAWHGSPTTTTSQIVQQAIAGAARAPTGEVHIRGQHAEYTYYVDGVPVPSSVGGTLNELFDPAIIEKIGFQTGGWDAEYGNKNIAVVNVETRIPVGGFHFQASAYGGSFNSNGETIMGSTTDGPWGALLSLTRQETSMRREPLQADASGTPRNFHNAGQDQYGFAKFAYTSERDIVTLDVNASRTRAGIPYDSSFGVLDDHQTDENAFANLAWRHRAPGAARVTEWFIAAYVRKSALNYEPGALDGASFAFYPDTADRFNVAERRDAITTGVKADFTRPTFFLGRALTFKTGVDASFIEGRENFNTVNASGVSGPSVNMGLRGGDGAAYAQAAFDASAHWQLRAGVRLDHHVAPVAGDIHQVSPRVRINWLPGPATTIWFYYGRLFIPSNVEDFHVLAAASQRVAGVPTLPERDHYFETGALHKFAGGVVAKVVAYYRDDSPAVDDNTLPGTALVATVNVARVRVTGLESVVEVHPGGPLSGYINAALSHASAHGPVTGGFFPTPYPTGWFDQDHDQRLSIVASGNYAASWGWVNLSAIFGSGLTNGRPGAARNEQGLFDFNPGVKVAPSLVMNLGVGTRWDARGTNMKPEISVDNLFDRRYLLKGAFTSGPSVGRPRSIVVRVTLDR